MLTLSVRSKAAQCRSSSERRTVSLVEAERLARRLAEAVRQSQLNPDLVIGIANGGAFPAFHVAKDLGVPLRVYRVLRASGRLKEWLGFVRPALAWPLVRSVIRKVSRYADSRLTGLSHDPNTFPDNVRNKRILLIDDCIDSGASMEAVRSMLLERGVAEVRIAVLSWTKRSVARYAVTPDFFLFRNLHCYPWSLENPEFPQFRTWLHDHPGLNRSRQNCTSNDQNFD